MPQPASRLKQLPPYVFMVISQEVQALERQGHHVYRLDIGNPDMPPPEHIIDSLYQSACDPNKHGYSGYRGVAAFRQAVADYYRKRFGVSLDPEKQVLPLIGSKEGIVNLALAYLGSGDVALVPSIAYPAYEMGARLAGATVHWLHMAPERGFRFDPVAIPEDVASSAKIMWINYPNNPTGATAERAYFTELVNFCAAHDILLASDNPYVDVTYGGYRAESVLQATNALSTAVEFMSFSKTYNMAGWRLGAAVGNADALQQLLQVKSNMDSGHFKAIYDAGIIALQETPQEWLDQRNAIYERRRDRIIAALPEVGLQANPPDATLYIWARVLDGDDKAYTHEARQHAHVSLAPGSAYGPGGAGYVRMSVAVEDSTLEAGLDQLRQWYATRHG